MSQVHAGDLSKTMQEMIQTTGLTNGKNWLRHSGQAQRIDEMLLVGATKQEIAEDIIQRGLSKRDLKTTLARVQRHFDHIGNEEHKLPIEISSYEICKFKLFANNS